MNVCIVGNGPSVFGAGMGHVIDSMDAVIRIHEWGGEHREDFGTKYSYGILPGPWIRKAIGQIKIVPEDGWISYYFYNQKSKDSCPDFVMGRKTHLFNASIDEFFSEILRRRLAPMRGTCSVFMAAKLLKPENIYLAGFDSVLSGKFVQYHDLTGQKLDEKYVGREIEARHDASYDCKMIKRLETETGIKIRDIKEWK